MPCNCNKTKSRHVLISVGNPPAGIRQARVTIVSNCKTIEVEDAPQEPPPSPGKQQQADCNPPTLASTVAFPRLVAAARMPAVQVCANNVIVTLDAGTTAGLKISEVKLGDDVYAANIAVNGSETYTEICEDPEECEMKVASVKIVDAAGVQLIQFGGFPVCRCKM